MERVRAGADLEIPFMDLGATQAEIGPQLNAALTRVADSGWYLLGPELEAFEQEFADYCGARHCVGVGSGLSAIELALRAAGIGPGDEVIVPAYTWIATWLAVSATGATPVPVDADPATFNIDASQIPAALTPRSAAIVPVHLRGEPADMDAVTDLARRHGLAVVEDAAQAHGAQHRQRRVGGLGTAGAFSFYPSKNLGALGDGGAVTTNDDELAARVRLLRNYGMKNRYEIEAAGVNSRLSEIQAAVLRVKLPQLDAWNRRRAELAGRYYAAFADDDSTSLPQVPSWADPVWHLFVINREDRDSCIARLRERGVQALIHYPVLPHLAPPYSDRGWARGSFPVAEACAGSVLSLPMFPQLDPELCQVVARLVSA
jgi:dTDP-3-amino-3,4,6-trideoxy-alpha-D-glucose transaminase